MLVMHFVEKDKKLEFLTHIKQCLKPQSPFVLADLMENNLFALVGIQICLSHQLGVTFEKAQAIKLRFENNFKTLTIEEFKAMSE